MKKNVGYIIMFIFGLITAGSIGVAAYNYNANNIEYSPSDKTWKVSTVAEAINSLVNDTKGSIMNYSEEEQVVGTWIDGRPVYQKTFKFVANVQNAWTTIGDYSLNNKEIIYEDGVCTFENGGFLKIPGNDGQGIGNGGAVGIYTYMLITNNAGYLKYHYRNYDGSQCNATLTIRYIKKDETTSS